MVNLLKTFGKSLKSHLQDQSELCLHHRKARQICHSHSDDNKGTSGSHCAEWFLVPEATAGILTLPSRGQ